MTYRSGGTTRGPLHFVGTTSPGLSVASEGRIYFDSAANKFKVSENGGAYVDMIGGGASSWASVLAVGALTGGVGNNPTLQGTDKYTSQLDLRIDAPAGQVLRIQGAGTDRINMVANTGSTTFSGAQVTTSSPIISTSQEWNNAGVVFTGVSMDITDTASAAGSRLLNLSVGGADQLTVGKAGKVTLYGGVATAGWGQPAIYGSGRSTGQTAAVASVASYTVGASDGSFDVAANLNVTASTTHSVSVTVSYTDETSAARTLVLNLFDLNGNALTTITQVSGTGPYSSAKFRIRCKSGTAITVATTGVFTSVTYNVEATIEQVT